MDEREAQLAEKAGIKKQSPPPAAPPAGRDLSTDGGAGLPTELPVKVAGRAAGLGIGVARRAVGVGLEVAGAVTNRAARLLGRGSDSNDQDPR